MSTRQTCQCGIRLNENWSHCALCGRAVMQPATVRTAPSCLLCDATDPEPCYLLPVDVHTTVSVHVRCLQASLVNMQYNMDQKRIYLEVE